MLGRIGFRAPISLFASGDGDGSVPFADLIRVVEAAEAAGFDSIWVPDPPQPAGVAESEGGLFEAYTVLGALAVVTKQCRLGALWTDPTRPTSRSPGLLGKQVTTLDVLSSGRAVLGVGLSGIEGSPDSEAVDRLDEAVRICKLMFNEDPATFAGRFYSIDRAPNRPRPVQVGGPPVLVDVGDGQDALLSVVAKSADACNLRGDEATIERCIEGLERQCSEVGRDPSSIVKTALVSLASGQVGEFEVAAARLFEMGVDAVILDLPRVGSMDLVTDVGRAMSEFRGVGRGSD